MLALFQPKKSIAMLFLWLVCFTMLTTDLETLDQKSVRKVVVT
jgi:hypothetical protein